jgi:hypothetical protein
MSRSLAFGAPGPVNILPPSEPGNTLNNCTPAPENVDRICRAIDRVRNRKGTYCVTLVIAEVPELD